MRILVALFALTLAAALPVRAEPIPLAALSRYLNGIDTATAAFTQLNADGTISTGRLWIHRPGRVRFEYDPPDRSLVLASGGQVAVFDAKSNQPPAQYPLRRTPLSLILDENVDLTRARMVTDVAEDGPSTIVTAQDPETPEAGSIRLVFTADPVELRQWVIRDEGGGETTVILNGFETGVRVPPSQFNIVQETERRLR